MEDTDVLILGAGFAGLTAARRLARRLGERRRVLVVDRNHFQTLRPKLPEAVGGVCHCAARLPVEDALRGTTARFLQTAVRSLDPGRRRVQTEAGPIGYRKLLAAMGSRPVVPQALPGAAELALPLWEFDQACDLRRRVTLLARSASRLAASDARRALASVAVVGGGFVGVEVAGHLLDRLHALGTEFGLARTEWEIHLLEQAPELLPGFERTLARAVHEDLDRRGVRVHTRARVQAVVREGVVLADGGVLPAGTVVWAGGVQAAEMVTALGAKEMSGRIPVGPDLRSLTWPDVFVAGDAAAVLGPDGRPLAPSAQFAVAEGAWAADSIARDLAGEALRPFRPHDRGGLVGLGARDALGHVAGLGLVGRPARLLKNAVLARYFWSLGGPSLLRAYFEPVFHAPWAGRVDPGCPIAAVQKADPQPRMSA